MSTHLLRRGPRGEEVEVEPIEVEVEDADADPPGSRYEAETCHTGGYLCGHRHKSRDMARRCLPHLPEAERARGAFSMATVVRVVAS